MILRLFNGAVSAAKHRLIQHRRRRKNDHKWWVDKELEEGSRDLF